MVKKYSRQITTTKKITPHKLRSTYGTALYQETGDIYLVADVLGHKDVNTTKKALCSLRRCQTASGSHSCTIKGGLMSALKTLSPDEVPRSEKSSSVHSRKLTATRSFTVVINGPDATAGSIWIFLKNSGITGPYRT